MKYSLSTKTIACVALLGLAACGGGSTSTAPTLEDLQDGFNDQVNDLGFDANFSSGLTLSAPSDISTRPEDGPAQYSGQLVMIVEPTGSSSAIDFNANTITTDAIVGAIEMTANFASDGGTVNGSATNFFNNDGSQITGTVTIGAVDIDRLPDRVLINEDGVGTVSGSLTGITGIAGTANLDGGAFGGFADPNASLWGVVSGEANASTNNAAFVGIFITSQDN